MKLERDMRLYVNVDHVATVRQARMTDEPDPVRAALMTEEAGADGITVHLREDRRHIQDRDVDGDNAGKFGSCRSGGDACIGM